MAAGTLLRRAVALDRLGSCIFRGPPGCGKTTLANVIAAQTNAEFIKLNAVSSGVSDVKALGINDYTCRKFVTEPMWAGQLVYTIEKTHGHRKIVKNG